MTTSFLSAADAAEEEEEEEQEQALNAAMLTSLPDNVPGSCSTVRPRVPWGERKLLTNDKRHTWQPSILSFLSQELPSSISKTDVQRSTGKQGHLGREGKPRSQSWPD